MDLGDECEFNKLLINKMMPGGRFIGVKYEQKSVSFIRNDTLE
jgi:hypothetical protein